MKNIELKKVGEKYYLQSSSGYIELSTKWEGLDRPKECRAVLSGLHQITQIKQTYELFESTFSCPNALAKFSFQISPKTKKYDYNAHKVKITEIALLLEGVDREYFIECIIKLISWVNNKSDWNIEHMRFEKFVVPDLIKLIRTNSTIANNTVIRNLENTFIHDSPVSNNEVEQSNMNRIMENGGLVVHVCCQSVVEILNKALAIGLPDLDFNVFVKSFNQHPLSGFAYNEFRNGKKLEVNIPDLITKINRLRSQFKNPELSNIFLKSIYKDAQIENIGEDWAPTLLEFNNMLEDRINLGLSATLDPGNYIMPSTPKLSMKQIALIHVYTGRQITRINAQEIAKNYGFNSTTSGEGLFQDYNFFSSTANRKGMPNPNTVKRLKNKILLLESILNYLPENVHARPLDEIKILKSYLEKEFE